MRTTTIEHFLCNLNCGISDIRDVKSLMTSKRPQKIELAVEQSDWPSTQSGYFLLLNFPQECKQATETEKMNQRERREETQKIEEATKRGKTVRYRWGVVWRMVGWTCCSIAKFRTWNRSTGSSILRAFLQAAGDHILQQQKKFRNIACKLTRLTSLLHHYFEIAKLRVGNWQTIPSCEFDPRPRQLLPHAAGARLIDGGQMISRPSEAKKKPFLAADLVPIPRIMSGRSINEYIWIDPILNR